MAKTIIKELADKKRLQAYINETQARFAPVFWPSLLTKKQEDSLRWDAVIGDRKSGVAGNVTAFNVSAPLHGRDALREEGGKIPSIRGKRVMNEDDMMKVITLRRQTNPSVDRILDLVYNDISFCSIAPHKRVDWMITKLLSNAGVLSFTNENNVGIVTQYDVDFKLPAENKTGVSVAWENTEDSDPLMDLKNSIFRPLSDKGISGGVIRMHPAKLMQMLESKKLLSKFGLLTRGQTDGVDMGIEKLNNYLTANNFATIRPFNASIGIEIDGKPVYSNPWNVNNVVWTPDGPVGQLHEAPIAERENPQDQVAYAEFMGALIKKWGQTDPVVELTGYELNAFPSLTIADEMRTMDTSLVQV